VVGDKQTTTNLRYKHGRNLNMKQKKYWLSVIPEKPDCRYRPLNSSLFLPKEDRFLCYPNNYNYYVNYYRNTFQHGGVSLEEMIVPVIKMESK
jgi:hypothetical protein